MADRDLLKATSDFLTAVDQVQEFSLIIDEVRVFGYLILIAVYLIVIMLMLLLIRPACQIQHQPPFHGDFQNRAGNNQKRATVPPQKFPDDWGGQLDDYRPPEIPEANTINFGSNQSLDRLATNTTDIDNQTQYYINQKPTNSLQNSHSTPFNQSANDDGVLCQLHNYNSTRIDEGAPLTPRSTKSAGVNKAGAEVITVVNAAKYARKWAENRHFRGFGNRDNGKLMARQTSAASLLLSQAQQAQQAQNKQQQQNTSD